MDFIMENWPLLVAAAAIVGAAAAAVARFVGLPTEKQLAKVKEWLLWAVTEAEKDLGGGTGKLKLRQVYDLFVQRFPGWQRRSPLSCSAPWWTRPWRRCARCWTITRR